MTWGLTTHGKYSVTGDEPHYLMVAQSLLADRDLDVGNNYAGNHGASFGASGVLPEQHVRQNRGRTLPAHDIGVSIALAPVLAIAEAASSLPGDALLRRVRMNRGLFAYSLVSLFMIAVTTGAAVVTIRALQALGASVRVSCAIVIVVWLSPPVISHAFLVFPELFALLVTAAVVRAWAAGADAWRRTDTLTVAALGLLPWFHRKFAFYVVALLAVLVLRRLSSLQALPRNRQAGLAAIFAMPPLLLAGWTFILWGNVAGPLALGGAQLSWPELRRGLPGTAIDRENGLLWWAPMYALLPAAFWMGRATLWVWLVPVFALVLPGAALQFWAGFSPAGRFLVPLAPIFCVLALEIARRRALLVAALVLLVPQVILTAYAWNRPRLLWPQGDGENRVLAAILPPLSGAYRAIPSFRIDPDGAWSAAAVIFAAILVLNAVLVFYDGSFVKRVRANTINAQSRNRRSP